MPNPTGANQIILPGVPNVSLFAGISAEDYGASPNASPIDNSTAINAALAAALRNGGGVVTLTIPGVFLLQNTLVIGSNTSLILAPGVTLRNASSPVNSYRPMLVSSNYSKAGATVTITSSGITCTVTWTAHGKAVGDWIAIAGASAETGYIGVFRVATVPTANTLTYTAFEVPSAGTASGTVFAWTADVNITISGGTWDYNSANLSGADSLNKMGLILVHTRNVSITDVLFENVNKYAIFPINTRDFVARSLRFDTLSDGIHFVGAAGVDVQDISGFFGDDILAFLSNEGTLPYSLGTWQTFPHRQIEARNLRSYASLQSGVKITGGDHPYRSFLFDGIYGQCSNAPFTIGEDPAFGLLAPDIDYIAIRNCRMDSWNTTLGCIRVVAGADSATIGRLEIDGLSATGLSGTQRMIDVRTTGAGVYTVSSMVVKNFEYECGGSMSGAGGGISVGTGGVIGQLVVDGFRQRGASANNFFFAVDGTVTRAEFLNGYTHSGTGFFVRINATAGAADVYLTNVHTQNGNNPVDLRRAVNLWAFGWKHSGSTCVAINGTGTYILRGGVDSGNTHISIAGGASVQLYGWDWRHAVLTTALAATTGQYCTSTESTPAAEAGPAVLSAAGWVSLGTGAAGINTVIA